MSHVLLWQPSECVHLIVMIVLCCSRKINMMMMMTMFWMPFEEVSGVGRGMGGDAGGDRQRGRGSFGVNVGHPIVTNGTLWHS